MASWSSKICSALCFASSLTLGSVNKDQDDVLTLYYLAGLKEGKLTFQGCLVAPEDTILVLVAIRVG
jgi:hypothetical protein